MIKTSTSDCSDSFGPSVDVPEVAVAGDRVALLCHVSSNNSSALELWTNRLGSRQGHRVAVGDGETLSGDNINRADREIGLLAGNGRVLVFLTWTVEPGGRTVTDERLWQINAAGAKRLVGSFHDVRAVAIDHGTVAVLQGGGTALLLSLNNGKRRVLHLQGLAARQQSRRGQDMALSQGRLVVLTRTSLDIYNTTDGSAIASWSLPRATTGGRGLLNAAGDYADYLSGDQVHVAHHASYLSPKQVRIVQLATGAMGVLPSTRLSPQACHGIVWAHVESVGLLYSSAYQDKPGCRLSRVGAIPFSELAHYLR